MKEQKRAEKLYKIEFVIMVVFISIGLLFALGIVGKDAKEDSIWTYFAFFNGYGNIVAMVICFVISFGIGKLYWKHKDIATYDEFGVRKDEKRRMEMDSKERRQLEMQSLAELERVLPRNTIEKKEAKTPTRT